MKKLLLLVVLLSFSSFAFCDVITINFEQYAEYTQITNQYQASDGVTFTNALQLVAPFYDWYDYPPHSGNGVITNDPNDPIQVNFTTSVVANTVSFWYAAPGGIVAMAYDANGNLIEVEDGASTAGSDLEIAFSSTELVRWFTVSANLGPDSETVDDLKYTATPEPGTLVLLGSGVLGLAGVLRRRLSR